jgi:hypothetical protein
MAAELLRDLLQETPRPWRDWKGMLVGLNIALVVGLCLAIPVLVSVALRSGAPLLGLIPALAAAGWLAVNRREKWLTFRVLSTALAVVCGAFILVMGFITPLLDRQKSFAYFFDAIRPAAAQRALYTTFCDDRRLPLISYYLGRRAEIVHDEPSVYKLLRSGQPLGIIIASKFYESRQAQFAAIPHRATITTRGQDVFTLVTPDETR